MSGLRFHWLPWNHQGNGGLTSDLPPSRQMVVLVFAMKSCPPGSWVGDERRDCLDYSGAIYCSFFTHHSPHVHTTRVMSAPLYSPASYRASVSRYMDRMFLQSVVTKDDARIHGGIGELRGSPHCLWLSKMAGEVLSRASLRILILQQS